jgi:hypothetical protein
MADVAITSTDVKMNENSVASVETAGEAIDPGEAVYNAGSSWMLSEAGDTADKAAAKGIAVTGTDGGGKKFTVCTGGELELGTVLSAQSLYVASNTRGKIAPPADLVSGDHVHSIGFAKSTSVLVVKPQSQGYQIA